MEEYILLPPIVIMIWSEMEIPTYTRISSMAISLNYGTLFTLVTLEKIEKHSLLFNLREEKKKLCLMMWTITWSDNITFTLLKINSIPLTMVRYPTSGSSHVKVHMMKSSQLQIPQKHLSSNHQNLLSQTLNLFVLKVQPQLLMLLQINLLLLMLKFLRKILKILEIMLLVIGWDS